METNWVAGPMPNISIIGCIKQKKQLEQIYLIKNKEIKRKGLGVGPML